MHNGDEPNGSVNLRSVVNRDAGVIRPLSQPLRAESAIAVLRSNLAPNGTIVKASAASPHLLQHQSRAVVFEDYADMLARIEDPSLEVSADSVLVLKNCGPKAVPGMPEWGAIPIPRKLQAARVSDMVRISDARMSAPATVRWYCTPALRPPPAAHSLLSRPRCDPSRLRSAQAELLLPENEIARRIGKRKPHHSLHLRGYPKLYVDHVLQCDEGCDFDFLRPANEAELHFVPPIVVEAKLSANRIDVILCLHPGCDHARVTVHSVGQILKRFWSYCLEQL